MAMTENRRKFERHEIDLSVRFISQKDLEASGRLVDISEGGLAMITEAQAEVGDKIIAYPEGLGRVEGVVRRKIEGGLAVEFKISEGQRTHLGKRIHSALTGVPYIRLLENRGHKRMKLNLVSQAQEGSCGRAFSCKIVDLSESGALVKASEKPSIGADIRIGSIRGLVRRHTPDGFALEFAQMADVAA